MYCLVSERKLRGSDYRGKYWRGALLNIRAVHTEQMPFIVCAIPSEAWGSLEIQRFIVYMNHANREVSADDHKSFMLCKAMGTANGVTYQIIARGGAGITRDDGEYPQRRMSLIASEQVSDPRLEYFNVPTRNILATRSVPQDREFDSLSMFYQNANLRFDREEFARFKRAVGSHWNSARDLTSFRNVLEQTYQ